MTTADKLITVAENVPKVYHAGQLNVIENASTLKKSVSGSAILIDDVSPVTHEMGVKVRGKNLVDDTKRLFAGGGIFFGFTQSIIPIKLSKGTYTFSVVTADGTTTNLYIKNSDNTKTLFTAYSSNKLTFTLSETQDILVSVYKSEYTSTEDVVTAQLELGTTATAYTPCVDLTAVKVTRYGKNLFNQYAQTQMFREAYRGIDITRIHKQIEAIFSISLKSGGTFQHGISFGLLCIPKDGSSVQEFWFQTSSDTDFMFEALGLNIFPYNEDCTYAIGVYPGTEENWNNVVSNYNMQIEAGILSTYYEPYKTETEYTPNADGTVDGVSSFYPNTTITIDIDDVLIDCKYYRDIDADEVISKTVTAYTNPKIKIIGEYAFYNCSALTSADFPKATSVGTYAFRDCTSLSAINFPLTTSVGSYAFYNCSALTIANFPVATNTGSNTFNGCSALTAVDFPAATSIEANAFYACSALTTADFPVATSIKGNAFRQCSSLTRVILRNNSVCSLSSTSAFTGCTKITGTGGYIYVPSSLVDAYKTATNWVTYASKFRALEDYTVDGTTTGALDESKVST